jgi:hypothetical protein
MGGDLLSPGFSKAEKESRRYFPFSFSELWQVRHFCTRTGAMSVEKLTAARTETWKSSARSKAVDNS